MTSIERADPDRERDVEEVFTGFEDEVLGRNVPDAHPPGGNLGSAVGAHLRDGPGRSVDRQDVARGESSGHRSGRRSRTTADLQHAGIRLQRQRIHDSSKSRRQRRGHRAVPDSVLRPQVGPIARSSTSCLAAQLSRKLGVDKVVDDSEVGKIEGQ